jgi:hypothetical protein
MTKEHAESIIKFYNSDATPYGLTYGRWTAEWWRWAMSIPKSNNPVIDETGRYADVNQPNDVWFLAGRFAGEDKHLPRRQSTIPMRRSILIPILNCEASLLEFPALKTEQELLDHISKDMNTIVKKECIVNGQRIPPQRVKSDPEIFPLSVHQDLGGLDSGSRDLRCAADGYWVFLKPLPAGRYNISFVGVCENGRLYSGASYDIRIV